MFNVVAAATSPAIEAAAAADPVTSVSNFRVESGDGGKRKQGDSGRQSRQGSGNPADPGRRPIANLSIATSETWRDKATGERKEKTEWHRVVIFNEGLCKVVEQYLKKGAKVYIEGALQTRKWTDQSGVEKYSTEVVLQGFNSTLTMLDGRSGGRRAAASAPMSPAAISGRAVRPAPRRAARSRPAARNSDMDDDIPF